MALSHTNRKGDCYFIFEGHTKTGKPTFYAAQKIKAGSPVESLPPDFEIYEQLQSAIVSVRQIKSSAITPNEVHFLTSQTSVLSSTEFFRVERSGESLNDVN